MTVPQGSVSLTASSSGIINTSNLGIKGLLITNESPFTVSIRLEGSARTGTLLPESVDFFPTSLGFNGNVLYSASAVLTNPSSYTANTLSIEAVGLQEPFDSTSFPVALTRPAVNPTATGNPIFTAQFGLGTSANNVQTLNIYNPANSGVDMIFHSAKVFTSDTTNQQAVMTYIPGADLNLATPVSVRPHTLQLNPPVSNAHVTFADDTGHGGTPIETNRTPTSPGMWELLTFPDTVTLKPGVNLLVVCSGGASGKMIHLVAKWSEQVAVPAPSLKGVPILTAANIVNDGNSAGTGIVEATVSGDSASAVYITNSGRLSLGDALHQGVILLPNTAGALNTVMRDDGSGNLIVGTPETAKLIRFFLAPDLGGPHLADLSSAGLDLSFLTGVTSNLLKLLTNGLTRIAVAGPYTVTSTPTFFNHGLGDVPTVAIPFIGGTIGTLHAIAADQTTMTSIQVKLSSEAAGGITGYVVSIKF